VLSEALFRELIDYSPSSLVSLPKYEVKERSAIPLPALRIMLSPTSYKESNHWVATVCAAYTGMRASEVRALEWLHLDFEKRQIHIVQAFKDQTKLIGLPKSGKKRIAPMPEGLALLLLAWRGRSDRGHKAERSRYVFALSVDRPLGYKWWNAAIKEAAAKAGYPGATLHYLRHSLNTHLLLAGVNEALLRESIGWVDAATQQIYTHPEVDNSSEASAIDNLCLTDSSALEAMRATKVPDSGTKATAKKHMTV
jgi:integrase